MSKYEFTCSVIPEYVPEESEPKELVYVFSYTVTITNTGSVPAQLIARHWIIHHANGHREEVKGLGVIGHQPLLRPGESFQYASGLRLGTASGTLHGCFFCVAEDGERFESPVAMQLLDAELPSQERVLH